MLAVTNAPSPSPLMITSLAPVRGNSVTSGVGAGVSGVGVGVSGVGVGVSAQSFTSPYFLPSTIVSSLTSTIFFVSISQTFFLPGSGFGGTVISTSSQSSLSPGIVGVSTHTVFLTGCAVYSVTFALTVKVFDSPTFRVGIVTVHAPFAILPSVAEMNSMCAG